MCTRWENQHSVIIQALFAYHIALGLGLHLLEVFTEFTPLFLQLYGYLIMVSEAGEFGRTELRPNCREHAA